MFIVTEYAALIKNQQKSEIGLSVREKGGYYAISRT